MLLTGYLQWMPGDAQSTQSVFIRPKLQDGVFTEKEFSLIGNDTIFHHFELYLIRKEGEDSVMYQESFHFRRGWTLSRYILRNRDFVRAGEQFEYAPSGSLLYIRTCNTKCDRYTQFNYYPNSNLLAKLKYEKGKLHGISYFYYNDASLKHVVEYNRGKLWNVQAYFDQNGNILDQGDFCDGTGLLYVYAANGNLISRKWYREGKLKKVRSVKH